MGDMGEMLFALSTTAFPGLFFLYHAWRDTEWFFNGPKGDTWVDLFGRKAARWIYGVLGIFFLYVTVMLIMFGH